MVTRYDTLRSFAFVLALLVVGCVAATALAQPGDTIAQQTSPWRNAHFVLYAYGAVWVGLVLYVWRLASLARRLDREVRKLERAVEKPSRKDDEP